MRNRLSFLGSIAVCASTAAVANAGTAPLAGTAHNPPLFIDESTTSVKLLGQGDDGYWFTQTAWITNYKSGDRVRLDWTQKGKVLGSAKCEYGGIANTAGSLFRCKYQGTPIKAVGAVDALLIYQDDADDKEYLLRTYKVTPTLWSKATWQLAADDLVGAAYVAHGAAGQQQQVPLFRFWVATSVDGADATLRCTVDGTKLADFRGTIAASGTAAEELEADVIPAKGERKTWHWQLAGFEPDDLHWGSKTQRGTNWLIDHPGAWDCQVRRNGVAIRNLLFTVNAKGMIESHPMQQAKNAAPLAPGVALIDIRIPAGAGFDQRIKPDVLKKSRGFGLAWPSDPSVAGILAALPPTFENAKPQPAPVAKGSGKILPGTAHTPARFVDETTTELQAFASKNGKVDGYGFRLYAVVAGHASGDKYRAEWKQNGKLLATGECTSDSQIMNGRIHGGKGGQGLAEVACIYNEPLTAKGAIEATLVLHDDQDGNDYLLRTYKVTIAKWTSFGDAVFGIVGDDLLGAGYVQHYAPGGTEQKPRFFFWTAHDDSGDLDFKLRCTVDGAKIADINVDADTAPGRLKLVSLQRRQTGTNTTYTWAHFALIANILWGEKATTGISEDARDKYLWMIDHPGAWSCALRNQGKAIREFAFTVDKKGMIVPNAMQSASGAEPMIQGAAMIDMRIPKESTWDERLRPDAMKKSRGFGLPWPAHPNVKAIHAALPAASGLPDPK